MRLSLPSSVKSSILTVPLLLSAGLFVACSGPDPQPDDQDAQPQPAAQAEPEVAKGPPEDEEGEGNGTRTLGVLDELAGELALREQERRALAKHYYNTGNSAFEQFDYAKAVEYYEKANDALPGDPTIQQALMNAQLLAGDRNAQFKTLVERLSDERQVRIDMQRAELERLYNDAEELFNRGEYERSITRFEMVLERIRWFPYKIDTEQFEESSRQYVVKAKRELREKQIAQREEAEAQALEVAIEEEQRRQREKAEKIDILLRKALDQLTMQRWEAAEGTAREVLRTDPANKLARTYLETIKEARHRAEASRLLEADYYETRDDFANTEVAAVPLYEKRGVSFPSEDYWLTQVVTRDEGIADDEQEEPLWVREYRQILETRRVTLNFPDTPLLEVMTFLSDITALNIVVSPSVDAESTTVDLRLREVPLRDALKLILEQTQLAYTFENQALLITQPDEARGEYILEIYDVQDLLSQLTDFPGDQIRVAGDNQGGGAGGGGGFTFDESEEEESFQLEPDRLEEIVTAAVGEDNWDDPASIVVNRGQLIVNQTRPMHREVREVLKNLRRNTGLFVQVETRFINMTDDFLRDIGVDFRGVGLSPGPTFGQPLLLDPGIPTSLRGNGVTQNDIGFSQQIPSGGSARAARLGPAGPGGIPFFGSNMLGGRVENVLDGGNAYFTGNRLNSAAVSGASQPKGLAFQASLLDPIQINAIVRAEQETGRRKIVQAPVITAANRQRVNVSAVTQRAYIADYEVSSGGTGLVVAEVADPIVETFQEGIILDVRPTISADRKYITLDVRPTLATLVGGSFRQIAINLGTIQSAALNVNIEVPQITLSEAFTSVTLPDGGTALLGGFRQINRKEERSGIPVLDRLPVINKLFHREGELNENLSILILVTARMVSVRDEERRLFGTTQD